MHRPLLFILISTLCAAGALLVQEPDADKLLDREAAAMQATVLEMQSELRTLVAEEAQELATSGTHNWMLAHTDAMEERRRCDGVALFGFVDDSLACWTGEVSFDPRTLLADTAAHMERSDGVLLHEQVRIETMQLHALRPVWSAPPITNRYLRQGFHPTLGAPPGLRAETGPGDGPVVRDANGQELFRLAWTDGAMELGSWLWLRLVLIIMASTFLVVAWWLVCWKMVDARKTPIGAAIFVIGLLALRTVTLLADHTAPFDRWSLFDPAIYATSWLFPSLGDLLINAMLLVVAAAFLRRALHRDGFRVNAWPVALLVIAAVLIHATWITRLCIGLINDSSIDMDLYHVQGVGGYGVAALLGFALLFASWLLVADTAVDILLPAKRWRVVSICFLIACAASIALHHWFGVVDTILFLWPVPIIALLAWGRYRHFRFIQGALVLCLLTGIGTHIVTKYMHGRERRERVVLAERLAEHEDPVVEQLFREAAPTLRVDTAVYRLLTTPAICGPAELEAIVRQPYFSGYWERYDVRVFGFDPQGITRCATDADPPRSTSDRSTTINIPAAVSDMPELFIDERSDEGVFYHARIAVMPNDSLPPAQVIVELLPRSLAQGLGFPALLLSGDDVLTQRTQRYAQARYANGRLMEQNGPVAHPQHWARALDEEGEAWYTEEGYEYLAKRDGATILVLGLPQRGIWDKATTFSYLFSFFGLLSLLVLLVRALVMRSWPSTGLGTKVRVALTLFAIIALVLFSAGSQGLLTRWFAQRNNATIMEKARSVQHELQRRVGDEPQLNAAHRYYLEHLLGQLGNSFFTDITLYAPDGRLLASSRPQIFSNGLLGSRMDPVAFQRLALRGMSAFVHQESIGDAQYRTAYVPLYDQRGAVLAHIALPSFADQAQQEEERSELLVAVVNLFVLLFALSVLLAVFISNWTTRPLDILKRALGNIALRGTNEPIRYRGRDEVGELVAVYNRKVEELRASADKLAQSERESAWKEMARQVAHEIKNPLTPMKLGIQHFQRSWDPEAPDAQAKLDRFSTSMVEQIDALSRVAGDFSRFAQMSAANETALDLNQVVGSAAALFAGEPDADIVLLPSSPLIVKADREHLLRVFNNLLKNALQAIPDGRRGKIEVIVRAENVHAVVEVRDNGTGIPDELHDHIFEPSFTTKSSGMGLGLAMVKRMAEQAGGSVRFETKRDEGTCFFITLPLVVAQREL